MSQLISARNLSLFIGGNIGLPPPPPDQSKEDLSSQWEQDNFTRHLKKREEEDIESGGYLMPALENWNLFGTKGQADTGDLGACRRQPSVIHMVQGLTSGSECDVVNLERGETLGDCFLKFAATLALFAAHPSASEGELSARRSTIISNYNLYQVGVEAGLPGLMYNLVFDPSNNWLPPCYIHSSPSSNKDSGLGDQATNEATRVNFPSEWTSVETGVWSNEIAFSETANPHSTRQMNEATYQMWRSNANEDQGANWDTLDGANGGFRGSNGSINGSNNRNGQSSPLGVFNLSEDLLSTIDQSQVDEEMFEAFGFDSPPNGASNTFIPPQNDANPADKVPKKKSSSRSKGKSLSSALPCLYTENCVSDKSIADCVEALIGCYLAEGGPAHACALMQYLSLPTITPELAESYLASEPVGEDADLESHMGSLEEVEDIIGYKFSNKSLLLQALTHQSSFVQCGCNYQRLEFIGDAIVDLLVTQYIFFHPHFFSSGALTDLRCALVNNVIFSSVVVGAGLQAHLRHSSALLHSHMLAFSQFRRKLLQEKEEEAATENLSPETQGATLEPGDQTQRHQQQPPPSRQLGMGHDLRLDEFSCEDVEVPKPLGDLFESLIGAVYIDSQFSLKCAWEVCWKLLGETMVGYTEGGAGGGGGGVPVSPMRQLSELEPDRVTYERLDDTPDHRVQVRLTLAPAPTTAAQSQPSTATAAVPKTFLGVSHTVRGAKAAAAQQALKYISSTSAAHKHTNIN